jgi:flagellar motility protein MotE (MotC chaperone)
MSTLEERLRIIAEDKQRLADEEAAMHDEALREIENIAEEIEALEKRKGQLEVFLGLEEGPPRAGHGQIQLLCIRAITNSGGGLTSSEIKEAIEKIVPGMKLTSVPSALSRAASLGRLRRDESGRYFLN